MSKRLRILCIQKNKLQLLFIGDIVINFILIDFFLSWQCIPCEGTQIRDKQSNNFHIQWFLYTDK